jgi:hypothetical protein
MDRSIRSPHAGSRVDFDVDYLVRSPNTRLEAVFPSCVDLKPSYVDPAWQIQFFFRWWQNQVEVAGAVVAKFEFGKLKNE